MPRITRRDDDLGHQIALDHTETNDDFPVIDTMPAEELHPDEYVGGSSPERQRRLAISSSYLGALSIGETKTASWECKKRTFSMKGHGYAHEEAQVACLFEEPVRPAQTPTATLAPDKIKALLCEISESLGEGAKCAGLRYRGPDGNMPGLPPHLFLNDVLLAWGAVPDAKPFILDFEEGEEVTPTAYDRGEIWESVFPPDGVDIGDQDGNVTYYRAEMKGADAPSQAHRFRFWIARDSEGEVLKSGWIPSEDAPSYPEFAWQPEPRGDLSQKATWASARNKDSAGLSAEEAFELYSQSIDKKKPS